MTQHKSEAVKALLHIRQQLEREQPLEELDRRLLLATLDYAMDELNAIEETKRPRRHATAAGTTTPRKPNASGRGWDEHWLDETLKIVPKDAREEVAEVFDMGLVLVGPSVKIPRVQVLMNMVRECRTEWEHQAREQGWTSKAEQRVAL